jgi:hypothetical protein
MKQPCNAWRSLASALSAGHERVVTTTSEAQMNTDLSIAFLVVLTLGFALGYAVRERKSRMRRRRYNLGRLVASALRPLPSLTTIRKKRPQAHTRLGSHLAGRLGVLGDGEPPG